MRDDDPKSTRWAVSLALALLVFIILGLGATRCEGAEVFRGKDDKGGPAVLKLYKEPCTNATILGYISPAFHSKFQRATLFYWGREWASCWFDHEGTVLSIDEQRSQFQPIPRRMFTDESV